MELGPEESVLIRCPYFRSWVGFVPAYGWPLYSMLWAYGIWGGGFGCDGRPRGYKYWGGVHGGEMMNDGKYSNTPLASSCSFWDCSLSYSESLRRAELTRSN